MSLFERLDSSSQHRLRGRRLGRNDYIFDSPTLGIQKLLEPLRRERVGYGLSVVVANAMDESAQLLLREALRSLNKNDVVSMIGLQEDGCVEYPGELSGESRPTVRYWSDPMDRPQISSWPTDVLILAGTNKVELDIAEHLTPQVSLMLLNRASLLTSDIVSRVISLDHMAPIFIRDTSNLWEMPQ